MGLSCGVRGNTIDFGSIILGSNPGNSTKYETNYEKEKEINLFNTIPPPDHYSNLYVYIWML